MIDDIHTYNTLYITLHRKEGLETGQSSLILHSLVWHFRSSVTEAPFSSGEKSAHSKEVRIMSEREHIYVIFRVNSSIQSLRMDVGIRSRIHRLLGEDDMIFRTFSIRCISGFNHNIKYSHTLKKNVHNVQNQNQGAQWYTHPFFTVSLRSIIMLVTVVVLTSLSLKQEWYLVKVICRS